VSSETFVLSALNPSLFIERRLTVPRPVHSKTRELPAILRFRVIIAEHSLRTAFS
jgi:hypothetical protein